MRTMILAALVATGLASSVHADPAQDALVAKAEKCIQTVAPEITAKAQSYVDAVYFTEDACLMEVEHAKAYEMNARTLSVWKAKHSDEQLAGVSLDPNTGELMIPPGFSLAYDTEAVLSRNEIERVTVEEELRAFAARVILSARSKSFQ